VIDEVYEQGVVAEDVISLCQERAWWDGVTGGVIDVAGRQHAGLPSHVEIWQAKTGLYLRSNRVKVVDGINRLRTFLRDPGSGETRLLVNPLCKGLIGEFAKYRYRVVVENRPVREEPIDRDNHALKALGYWLYAKYGPVEREDPIVGQISEDRLKPLLRQHLTYASCTKTLEMQEDGTLAFAYPEVVSDRSSLRSLLR
jgi:hypothetical protein